MIKLPSVAALAVVVLSTGGLSTDGGSTPGAGGWAEAAATLLSSSPGLAARPGLALEPDKGKVEEVQIKTQDKQELAGSFYPSKRVGRAPAVLLVHDAGSDRSAFTKVARSLQKRGFAVLSIDLRGHGASVTEAYNWGAATDEQHLKTWALAMRDLVASTSFLRERDDVHNSNLSLVGVGAGAALAVKYALRDENARAVVLVAPQAKAYGYDMLKDVFELGGLPTMIMTPKAARQQADELQEAANRGNDGIEYVKLKVLKLKQGEGPLTDKHLPKVVTDFLRGEAMPGR